MTDQTVPTYEDAQLILKLYELRREEKLRHARDWVSSRFFPKSVEDVQAALAPGSVESAYLRMVLGYWEMAASFVNHGILHAELFVEGAGEMLLLWAKMEGIIAPAREKLGAGYLLVQVEKLVRRSAAARERIEAFQKRLPTLEQAARSAAKGSPPAEALKPPATSGGRP